MTVSEVTTRKSLARHLPGIARTHEGNMHRIDLMRRDDDKLWQCIPKTLRAQTQWLTRRALPAPANPNINLPVGLEIGAPSHPYPLR